MYWAQVLGSGGGMSILEMGYIYLEKYAENTIKREQFCNFNWIRRKNINKSNKFDVKAAT